MAKKRRKPRPRRPPSASPPAKTSAEAGAAATPRAAKAPRRPIEDERPPAPWGSFPLVEILVLVALVMLVVGFFAGGDRSPVLLGTGLALGSLAGLELSIREHFAGYRSHTTVLAGVIALTTATAVALIAGKILLPILFAIALVVFVGCFYLFRRVFRRRSGGLSFR